MIKKSIMLLLVCSSLIVSNSLQIAEQAYNNQTYQEALTEYESSYVDYPDSIDLNYNLGNVCFKLGNIGKSIYFYKKALYLSPNDKEINENLELTRGFVLGLSNEDTQVELLSFLSHFTGKTLLILCLCLIAILNGLVFYYINIKPSEVVKNVGFLCFFILFISTLFLGVKEIRNKSYKECVVIVKKTAVKSGPSSSFKELFFIHEGYEFRELLVQDEWSKVRLLNGAIGWVKRSDYWSI
jgi:tetratricopeptide (TPR) repeat protein